MARSQPNLARVFRPIFVGQGINVSLIAASSFFTGITESALLVLIAHIGLAVGKVGASSSLQALGPVGSLRIGLGISFVIALLLGLARFGFQTLAAHLISKVTADLTSRARAETFADFISASWAEQARHSEAEIQDLLVRHVNRVTSAIATVSAAINTFFTFLALFLSAFVLGPTVALLLILSGGILFLALRPLSRWAKRVSSVQQMAGLNYGTRALEAISISMEIRSYGVAPEVSKQLAAATAEEVRPTYVGGVLRNFVAALYQLITILLILGGLYVVHYFLDEPIAAMGAIVLILVRALSQSNSLQSSYHSMLETAPYVERLQHETLAFREAIPAPGIVHITSADQLQFMNVDYAYDSFQNAVEELTFTIEKGEAVGVIGPSGSGKSTLIQLLLRLRSPVRGDYLINGIRAKDVRDEDWFPRIAFMPQDSNIIDATVADNISFYREATHDEVVEAAKRAHIHDEIMAMTHGYETVVGSRGGALSGGQRQRISLARALLKQPSILVLDEPTSALDMRSEALVHQTLSRLKGEVTIIAIAHRLSTLNICDRILVLDRGRIEAFGTREELDRNNGFYRDAISLSHIRS